MSWNGNRRESNLSTDDDEDAIDLAPIVERSMLSLVQKVGYSVGHVMNDLCSAIWFTYLLVYMELVIQFSNKNAGLLLMIGQVADGLSTPFVGYFSGGLRLFGYQNKKSWHLLGSICVLGSFPLIFSPFFGDSSTSIDWKLAYYVLFIIIFQFGWAAVQVSHLSLIPDLTPSSNERIGLNSLRYSWTVIASITVYLITWFVLSVDNVPHNSTNHTQLKSEYESHNTFIVSATSIQSNQIGPDDAPRFRILIITILTIGSFFTCLFHFIVAEPSNSTNSGRESRNAVHLKPNEWLCLPQFYVVGLLYTACRIVSNVTQVYIPFYLHFTLNFDKTSVAYIPLIMYISGFFTSLVTKATDNLIGKRIMLSFGTFLSLAAYSWLRLDKSTFFTSYGIYIVVVLLGISASVILITALGITNDLIGDNTTSGAFVIGVMSFFDKVTNGVCVLIIQYLHPTEDPRCEGHVDFYRNVLSYTGGGANIITLIALSILSQAYSQKSPSNSVSASRQENAHESDTDPLIDV